LVSPDIDFSPTGAKSGIKYTESFLKYKEMLSKDPSSPVYKRIFSKINTSIFGLGPLVSKAQVAEDGGYESEIEQFNAELLADSPDEAVSDDNTLTLASPSQPIAKLLTPEPPVQLIPAPGLPVLPERHVSISVTSQVSTNSVGASQVSNIVSSNVILPQAELEITPPLPGQKVVARPAPRRKTKKMLPVESESNVVNPTLTPSNATKGKTIVDPPSRVLRKRG
jgi:hypothetical protein